MHQVGQSNRRWKLCFHVENKNKSTTSFHFYNFCNKCDSHNWTSTIPTGKLSRWKIYFRSGKFTFQRLNSWKAGHDISWFKNGYELCFTILQIFFYIFKPFLMKCVSYTIKLLIHTFSTETRYCRNDEYHEEEYETSMNQT